MNDTDTTFHPDADSPHAADTADEGQAGSSRADERTADPAADLKRERDDFEDRWLRQTAEFDNYRKRVERERRELLEHAASDVLHDLLPLLDDIERALEAVRAVDDPVLAAHRQGLELIHRQFHDVLRKRHVSAVESVGADFDPNVHQAVGQEVSEAHREGEVIEEMRRGYMLKERLLRPSMVKVATRG